MQYVDIKNSKVTFINEEKDPVKKTKILESELATMAFESKMDKAKIVSLEDSSAMMAFEIMQLKMGGN